MKKLVFIAGLSHSGTTLLDLVLGCYPQLTGLGEVARVVDRPSLDRAQFENVICSCGERMTSCPVWGDTLNVLEALSGSSVDNRYSGLLEAIDGKLTNDTIIVDSSKYVNYLKFIVEKTDIKVKVVYIVKDVRNYVISQIDNIHRNRDNRKSFGKNNSQYFFWQWYMMNKNMQEYLDARKLDYLKVGYEELCLSTEKVLKLIGNHLGVEIAASGADLNRSKSHSVLGNRMRTQKEKRKILYDYRWFQRKEWQLPMLLYPQIANYNKANVYSNNLLEMWRD